MAMAASASTSATGPSLHDPLRPTPPPNVSASNSNAVPWDEQVVPALRKRLEAESAQLAERIKGSSQNRASIQRGPPDGAAGQQYPSSPPSNSSGSVVFGAGAGSGVVRRGSKVDMDTARQRARAIRERRDSSAPVGGRGQDGGAYAGSQAQNDYYSYGAGGSASATVGRRGSKAGPSSRGGGMLPPSSSSSTSSSAFFPSASAAHQQQELSSSPYRGAGVRPPSGSSSSSRVRTQSTPMQYMGPSSSRASSSSSSAAPARYAAAAPPVPQAATPQSRQSEAARQRNGQQLYNDGGGQRSRDGGQMDDFEMVPASHESRRYEPPSPNGARSGAASGTTSKYGEAMAPRWPSSQAHLAAPSAASGTAAKLRSATVSGAAHFDAAPPASRLPPSSSDPQLLDSFSPLSPNNAYTPTSRSTRAVTEPPPDLPGPSPWDWDEVLPPTIARRVAQEELLKRDPSLQGVEELIDTWDRSGLPMTQKGIRDLVERSVSGGREEEERGGRTVDGGGATTTTTTPAAASGPAEDPSSSSSYSYSSMPSSNNANRQVRLSSLVDGLGLGGSSSRDGGQRSLPEEGEGTRGSSTADTKTSRQKQQQQQHALQEEQDGEMYQHYQQQQQHGGFGGDGQQGIGQTSASTAASASKAGQKQQDDAHDAGCCASCVVM